MRLLLVCDGSGDIANLKKLTHRILCENHDWLIDHELVWVEYEPGRTFLDIHHVHAAADARKIPTPRGVGMGHGAASAKRAFLLGKKLAGESKELGELGVVFVWDVDNDPKRIAAIDEARASTNGLRIAVGLATPEHEAWCICAVAPETAEEQAAHDAVKGDLGFDPLTRSHELSHKKASVTKKDAKTVLARLCPDSTRFEEFLKNAPLSRLRERGEKNGLRAFHDEVQTHLAPLFGPLRKAQ